MYFLFIKINLMFWSNRKLSLSSQYFILVKKWSSRNWILNILKLITGIILIWLFQANAHYYDYNALPSLPSPPSPPAPPTQDNLNQDFRPFLDDVTITLTATEDAYTTIEGTYYNSVPVTLTEFVKRTRVVPTVEVSKKNKHIFLFSSY